MGTGAAPTSSRCEPGGASPPDPTTATGVVATGGGADWRPSKKVNPNKLTANAAAIPTSAERGIRTSSSAIGRQIRGLPGGFPLGKSYSPNPV